MAATITVPLIPKGQKYIKTSGFNNYLMCDKHLRFSTPLKIHLAIALENSYDEALKLQTPLSVFACDPDDSLEVQEHSSDWSQRRDIKKNAAHQKTQKRQIIHSFYKLT